MRNGFGVTEIETVKDFADLFFRSRYYVPVQAVLDKESAEIASTLPGYRYWVAPSNMIKGKPNSEGLAPWQPVASPIDEALTTQFEEFIGAVLPRLFKCYLCYSSMLNMDLVVGTLPDIDPLHPLSWLEWYVITSRGRPYNSDRRLIPFTLGPALASDLCFDTEHGDSEGGYPIIQVKDRSPVKESHAGSRTFIFEKVFNNFNEYFDFLKAWMRFTVNDMPQEITPWKERNPMVNPPHSYYD